MNATEFSKLAIARFEGCLRLLNKKAESYARVGADRLQQFKRLALVEKRTPEAVLLSLWNKQHMTIVDLVEALGTGDNAEFSKWEERIEDCINYAVLLEGLLKERMNDADKKYMEEEFGTWSSKGANSNARLDLSACNKKD